MQELPASCHIALPSHSTPRSPAQLFILLMSRNSCHSASIQLCRASLLCTWSVFVTSSSPNRLLILRVKGHSGACSNSPARTLVSCRGKARGCLHLYPSVLPRSTCGISAVPPAISSMAVGQTEWWG